MIFGEIITKVQQLLQDTSDETRLLIKDWINESQIEICNLESRYDFLESKYSFLTSKYSESTFVGATVGGYAILATAIIDCDGDGKYRNVVNGNVLIDDDIYRVYDTTMTETSNGTLLYIEPFYRGATISAATTKTGYWYKDTYIMPNDMDKVFDVRIETEKIDYTDEKRTDSIITIGKPNVYRNLGYTQESRNTRTFLVARSEYDSDVSTVYVRGYNYLSNNYDKNATTHATYLNGGTVVSLGSLIGAYYASLATACTGDINFYWSASADAISDPNDYINCILIGKTHQSLAGNITLELEPAPDDIYKVDTLYYKKPNFMVNDYDVPVIPDIYHEALVWGAVLRGIDYHDCVFQKSIAEQNYNKTVTELRRHHRVEEDMELGLYPFGADYNSWRRGFG